MPTPPLIRLQQIANEYDERGGDNDTLQGALATSIVLLTSEANRNGWASWGSNYEECIDMLLRYLCDGATAPPSTESRDLRTDLEAIRDAGRVGADEGLFAYKECDRVAERVLAWCESHRRPIHKAPGQDLWFP